jgi:hypothetical protein
MSVAIIARTIANTTAKTTAKTTVVVIAQKAI